MHLQGVWWRQWLQGVWFGARVQDVLKRWWSIWVNITHRNGILGGVLQSIFNPLFAIRFTKKPIMPRSSTGTYLCCLRFGMQRRYFQNIPEPHPLPTQPRLLPRLTVKKVKSEKERGKKRECLHRALVFGSAALGGFLHGRYPRK